MKLHIMSAIGPLLVLLGTLGLGLRLIGSYKSLTELRGSSAEYIEAFPNNLKQITELVKRTKTHLVVIADYPGYANYTAPDLFDDYWKAIRSVAERSNPKPVIDTYFYDSATAECAQQLQFAQKWKPEARDAWKTDKRFAKYMEYRQIKLDQQPKTSTELDQFLLKFDEHLVAEMTDLDIHHHDISVLLPMFIWMRDGEEAAFSFYNLGDDVREVSLRTEDRRLIADLEALEKAVREHKVPGAGCVSK